MEDMSFKRMLQFKLGGRRTGDKRLRDTGNSRQILNLGKRERLKITAQKRGAALQESHKERGSSCHE